MATERDPLWFRFAEWRLRHPRVDWVLWPLVIVGTFLLFQAISWTIVKYPRGVDEQSGSDATAVGLGLIMWAAGTCIALLITRRYYRQDGT